MRKRDLCGAFEALGTMAAAGYNGPIFTVGALIALSVSISAPRRPSIKRNHLSCGKLGCDNVERRRESALVLAW